MLVFTTYVNKRPIASPMHMLFETLELFFINFPDIIQVMNGGHQTRSNC